jgi:hypothetical protein
MFSVIIIYAIMREISQRENLMKPLTNKHNIPPPIYRAISNDSYSKGWADYSVTELLKPTRAATLEREHDDEIENDAMDYVWNVFGKAVHNIMEQGSEDSDSEKSEMRLFAKINGKTVSGQIDYMSRKQYSNRGKKLDWSSWTLWDYKVTSVWTLIYAKDEARPEWVTQLNDYRLLAEKNWGSVDQLFVAVLLRDWSQGELTRRIKRNDVGNYPLHPLVVVPIPLLDLDAVEASMTKRMNRILAVRSTPDMELPLCTAEERWEQPTKYAVMKKGNKKATKLFDDIIVANEFINKIPLQSARRNSYVETRQGISSRCERYCNAAPFCSQWKAEQESLVSEIQSRESLTS